MEKNLRASSKSSPASALKQMEQMMGRNYSDFMRSLASKYNQTNAKETNGELRPSTNGPFFMPGNPFQLAAAAAAAAAASSLPVNLPSAVNFFQRPPITSTPSAQNVMEQMSQTQQALLSMMKNVSQQNTKAELKRGASAVALDLSPQSIPAEKKRKSSSATELSNSMCTLGTIHISVDLML